MTLATLGLEIRALNAMNNFRLSMIRKTLGSELRAQDSIKSSRL